MALWQDNLRKIEPYTPGEQPNRPNMIKLNTNENPYPPAPGVTDAIRKIGREDMRLYPDPDASALVNAISKIHNTEPERIFVGVGSDDVLAMSFMSFFNSEKPIFFPDITYSFYPVWASLFKVPYKTVPLKEDFSIDPKDYYVENGGVLFPNPNAPTSRYESLDVIKDILKHNTDCVVIIDEAYIDFGGESALSLINDYDNLLVVRTFSKSRSMAGMRLGYALGSPELIRALKDVKFSFNSYTLSPVTIQAGVAAMEDEEYFRESISKIIATRERSKERLRELGFSFPEPMGNFIFATHREKKARDLFSALRENDIYVRYFDKPRIDNYLRITIGRDDEMDRLFDFLGELL